MPSTPVYETTVTVRIRYPGASPDEAYALHNEFVGAIRAAAQVSPGPTWAERAGLEGVRAEVASSDGPELVVDPEEAPTDRTGGAS